MNKYFMKPDVLVCSVGEGQRPEAKLKHLWFAQKIQWKAAHNSANYVQWLRFG